MRLLLLLTQHELKEIAAEHGLESRGALAAVASLLRPHVPAG